MPNRQLSELPNIGKTVASRLHEIGVSNELELKELGAAKAYRWLSEHYPNNHLPVCYYLYSLEGALQNRHWDDFSEEEKSELRATAGIGFK